MSSSPRHLRSAVVRQRWGHLVDESIAVRQEMREALTEPLGDACRLVTHAIDGGNKVILCGNGGSAADAQHIAAEFVGRYKRERAGWPALALSENVASITAIGNDYGYSDVFRRQLEAFAHAGDVFIALTTSGRSQNVVNALAWAHAHGISSVVITGYDAPPPPDGVAVEVRIPARSTAATQEGYLLFLHALCDVCEEALTADAAPGDSPNTSASSAPRTV